MTHHELQKLGIQLIRMSSSAYMVVCKTSRGTIRKEIKACFEGQALLQVKKLFKL